MTENGASGVENRSARCRPSRKTCTVSTQIAGKETRGQSNTAQDIIKSLEGARGGHVSLLTEMVIGMGAGFEAGGIHGAGLGAAAGSRKPSSPV